MGEKGTKASSEGAPALKNDCGKECEGNRKLEEARRSSTIPVEG